jgi:hypothetical protein
VQLWRHACTRNNGSAGFEVPAERLAILNHVASATTRLAAGTTIKRVVS